VRVSSATAAVGVLLLVLSALSFTVFPMAVVVVDLTPPTITFVSPENLSTVYVGQTIPVRVDFEDRGSGLNTVSVAVKDVNGNVVASDSQGNLYGALDWTISFSWTPSAEGVYTIKADALDMAGNYSTSTIAVATKPTYTLTISVNNSAWGTTDPAPGAHTYPQGQQVTVTAIPASGYRFSYWSGDASGTSASITVTVDRNKSITANFEVAPQTYTLTVSVYPSGSGTVVDENGVAVTTRTVASGTSLKLTAKPNSGYEFQYWSGDASGTSSTITVTVTKNTFVTANFRKLEEPSGRFVINYQEIQPSSTIYLNTPVLNMAFYPSVGAEYITGVTVTIDGASIALQKSGSVWEGTYTLPGEGKYTLNCSLSWSGGTVNVCSVSLSYSTESEPSPPGKVNISVSVVPAGAGSVVGNYGLVDNGSTVELTAYPNEGYRFVEWRGDVCGTDPVLVFVANRDMHVQAVFEKKVSFWEKILPIAMAASGIVLLGSSFFLRYRGR
jgi:hypothetical protein